MVYNKLLAYKQLTQAADSTPVLEPRGNETDGNKGK